MVAVTLPALRATLEEVRKVRWLITLAVSIGIASCQDDCSTSNDPGGGGACCKVCTDSKPCGDSCIPSNQTCHKIGGCACVDGDPRLNEPLADPTKQQ